MWIKKDKNQCSSVHTYIGIPRGYLGWDDINMATLEQVSLLKLLNFTNTMSIVITITRAELCVIY